MLPRVGLTFVALGGCILGGVCLTSEFSTAGCDLTVAQEAPKKEVIRGWMRLNFLGFAFHFFCVFRIPSCIPQFGQLRRPARSDPAYGDSLTKTHCNLDYRQRRI